MPENASVKEGSRRAAQNEEFEMTIDSNGQVCFLSLRPGCEGEVLEFVDNDEIAIDHIPECLDRILNLDGLEKAYVRGVNFCFPYHNDSEYSISAFADCGVTAKLVRHYEAGFVVVGDALQFFDPVEIDDTDQFGSVAEGC